MWRRLLTILPKALLLGLGLGVGMRFTGLSPDLWIGVGICLIFSMVMWGGFHLSHPFLDPRPGRPPGREAMRTMGLISLLYVGLLALCVGLIRLAFGINLFAHPVVATVTFTIGFAVTNFITAAHAVSELLEAQEARAKAEARAGLLALQSQLQPHTLFNALNGIAALIPEDPLKAEAATEALSRLLRRIMEAFEKDRWSLKEEFSVLEDLLSLERMRFGARLRAHLELDPASEAQEVPPLLLLPLVENALKHGFRPKVGPCSLNVRARNGVIQVEDDGVGCTAGVVEGVGLRTVRERLEAEGGGLAWVQVDQGCVIEVRLRQ